MAVLCPRARGKELRPKRGFTLIEVVAVIAIRTAMLVAVFAQAH